MKQRIITAIVALAVLGVLLFLMPPIAVAIARRSQFPDLTPKSFTHS